MHSPLPGSTEATPRESPDRRSPFAVLRRFARPRPTESCELCGTELAEEHEHLLEPANRQLHCCCDPCSILFSGQTSARYRRVPRRIEYWPDFRLTDSQWEALHLPINLVFFSRSSSAGKVMAHYPSPAGATESLLTLDAWQEMTTDNPNLADLEPDVEALLVNRIEPARDYYRAPIDQCFKLVGLIRANWRGLSGGTEVWREIERFFGELKERAFR
jgi:Family of unknown function (DUF5947)